MCRGSCRCEGTGKSKFIPYREGLVSNHYRVVLRSGRKFELYSSGLPRKIYTCIRPCHCTAKHSSDAAAIRPQVRDVWAIFMSMFECRMNYAVKHAESRWLSNVISWQHLPILNTQSVLSAATTEKWQPRHYRIV